MNRRDFLRASAISTGLAFAGCTALPDGIGGSSLPSYHTSIPAESIGDSGTLVYIDVSSLYALGVFGNSETTSSDSTETETSEGDGSASPLIGAPVTGSIIVTAFSFGLGLGAYGDLGERLNSQFDPDGNVTEEENDLEGILFTPNAVVINGSFDTEVYSEELPSSFEEATERGSYTLYTEGNDEASAIAISSERLVFNISGADSEESPRAAVERVLDARAGDVPRLTEEDAEAKWALQTAGSHTFVIGSFGDTQVETDGSSDRTYNPVAGTPLEDVPASPTVSGASIQTSGGEPSGATADTALAHTEDPVEESAIREAYTGSAAEISVSTSQGQSEDIQRVHISGEFNRDGFGL
jgi:hypothetical protein